MTFDLFPVFKTFSMHAFLYSDSPKYYKTLEKR
jgi:hypothetical protein